MAHKKSGGSSKNGRDSNAQRLGVKAHDGQLISAGSIIIRVLPPGRNLVATAVIDPDSGTAPAGNSTGPASRATRLEFAMP